MKRKFKKPGFVELYRGATLNIDLLNENSFKTKTVGDVLKYFITDIYGISYEVNRTHYFEIKRAVEA